MRPVKPMFLTQSQFDYCSVSNQRAQSMRHHAQNRRKVGILCLMKQASRLSSEAQRPAQCARMRVGRAARLGVCVIAAMLLVACNDGVKSTDGANAKRDDSARSGQLELMDPADEVVSDGLASSGTGGGARGARSTAASASQPTQASAESERGRWSVMLATFSEAGHAERANAFRSQLVREFPEIATAQVRRVGNGSAIVVGRFTGPEDKAAQTELKRVKSIERNGRKPFAGAMLLRTSAEDSSALTKPHSLRSLRAKFPNVRPLYTLQVGAWSTFGDAKTKYEPMRTAAERYCAELRSKGYEAWFYHDDDSETSIVTVGHFNRSAYDSRSTLMSPEVEDLMRQFPAHLTNGEPVLLPVDRTNPKGRMKAQTPRLVEVPTF